MADGEPPSVPRNVLQAVSRLDAKLRLLDSTLTNALHCASSSSHPLLHLPPIDRASALLNLSKAANALFSVFIRTTGESPKEHPAKSEVERVELYEDKVERAIYRSKAPSRPPSSLDVPAANRFIEHSIPDLTNEQRKRVREVSEAKSQRLQSEHEMDARIRKSPRKDGESVAQAAAAFLAKAQRELLAENKDNPSEEECSDHLSDESLKERKQGKESSQAKSQKLQLGHEIDACFKKSPRKDGESVAQAAAAFLAEAQRELLAENKDDSSEEDSSEEESSSDESSSE